VKRLQNIWMQVGDGLQLGASIVIAIFLGAYLGWELDKYFGTFPYLSILFFGFGLAAAVKNVWIAVRKELRADKDKQAPPQE
jgi:ATP synthase protein I